MSMTGVTRQEQKIDELAREVGKLHPGLNHLSVKGAFRFAVSECVKVHGFADWKEVSGKPAEVRRQFFDCLCKTVIPKMVKLGLPPEQCPELEKKLKDVNRKYLQP
ncbi:hypothetical protein [Desulfolutivibrio sp.]|uniref:hypothetical protein n=1 Tax=Desulfolutivibrio sp. TaxID=2773296 RepID=UPI002F96A2CA